MAEMGTNPRAHLPRAQGEGLHVDLDRDSPIPIHVQLEVAIRDAIRNHRLPGDSVVPASRRLADQLGVSRGVVVEAYQQLTAEGYLVSHTGGYTRVAKDVGGLSPAPVAPSEPARPASIVDFRYGRPDVSQFPRAAWLRTLRSVLSTAPNERLGYIEGAGAPELTAALAEYLNRVRGTWAVPSNVIACNGFAQAVTLLLPVLAERGVRRLAVEDPSDTDMWREAKRAGLELVPVPVTPTGIDTDVLMAADAQAVLVTPAHQFPTGCVLSPERRTALVEWARSTGGLIIEDDYDAEYRYDQTPVGSLQGLAPDHVVYAGTASKTLAPGLRLGWMIAPERLAGAIATRKFDVDRGSPVIDQLAFAEFLSKGELDRHLRRMRTIYRERRDALLDALADLLPEFEPVGIAAGLHVVCWLPDGIDDDAVVAAAADRGVVVTSVSQYRLESGRPGVILGYSRVDLQTVREGVARLRDAVRAIQSSS